MFRKAKILNLPLKSLKPDQATLALFPASSTKPESSLQSSAHKASKQPRPVFDAHYSLVIPTPPPGPLELISFNEIFASEELGLDVEFEKDKEALMILSGSQPIHPDFPKSWAYCYGGHQFGSWAGQLGDGRAISIGQLESPTNHQLYELSLKGAGLTPYSRFADGYAVIRSSIREYLCAEAMYYLGIPSSRSLSIITTGQEVLREEKELGAVVCRVAPSWIRFGNFEIFYARNDIENLKVLADYVIETHFQDEISQDHSKPKYQMFLKRVVRDTAIMIANWQAAGFCHGVMNTDNFSILGITIDYGPFQFLDAYDPTYICNHSGEMGRYAFMEQPSVGLFNLVRLTTALSPLLDLERNPNQTISELVKPILDEYGPLVRLKYQQEMCKKFGFVNLDSDSTNLIMDSVIQPMLLLMEEAEMDYTIFFRTLSETSLESEQLDSCAYEKWIACSYRPASDFKVVPSADSETEQSLESRFHIWYITYRNAHYSINGGIKNDHDRFSFMKKVNPKYILRNHVVQKVIEAVEIQTGPENSVNGNEKAGTALLEKYLRILQNPFEKVENAKEDDFFGGMVPKSQRNIKCSCSS